MGFFRYLILLFCLCTITLTQAQRYEVDCLVSSEKKLSQQTSQRNLTAPAPCSICATARS